VSKAKTPSGVDMGIVDIPCAELHNDPANVRKHGEQNLAAIKASLARFGQQKPIVVNQDGVVIAGNGTLMAARALGWQTIKAVRTNLAGSEATAFAIADNRTAELAEWDDAALQQQLAAIAIDDEELLAATGFDEKELAKLAAANAPEVTEDDVPEPPAEPITQPGDLWLLGKHRLLCGDSTKAEDVERLMDGKRADLMLTDPPYNVALGIGESLEEAKKRNRRVDGKVVANDSMSDTDFRKFLVACFTAAFGSIKPGASFYIFHADSEGYNFRGAVKDCGQVVRQCLIWAKDILIMGRQDYQWQHEPCLYGWKEGAAHGWYSDRKQTTLLRFDRPKRSEEHPTMKPVAMFAYLIGNSTAPQGLVYDPFLGSGTTIVAAEQLGRVCYGMELSPAYCDVIVKRWETLTGQTATREEV
jgi:site-specific DNA-methyltransferase (adenine-specific)